MNVDKPRTPAELRRLQFTPGADALGGPLFRPEPTPKIVYLDPTAQSKPGKCRCGRKKTFVREAYVCLHCGTTKP